MNSPSSDDTCLGIKAKAQERRNGTCMASICSLTARNAERLDQLVRVTGLARSELANMVLGWTLAQIEDGDWELIQAILTDRGSSIGWVKRPRLCGTEIC